MSGALEELRRRYGGHVPGLLGARRSCAVLCPLMEASGGAELLFEVRAANLRQGGEVCFPGGRMEPGETAISCALRETEEELSIPRGQVEVLGLSDFLCNQRGFLIQPVLGLVSPAGMAAMAPSPAEVAAAFTVPLAFFRETEPAIYRYQLVPQGPEGFPYEAVGVSPDYPWSRGEVEVPVWYYEGRVIWGMTARIIRDVVRSLRGKSGDI